MVDWITMIRAASSTDPSFLAETTITHQLLQFGFVLNKDNSGMVRHSESLPDQ